MTVHGPVPAAAVGRTLVHEHVYMDAAPLLGVHGYAATGGQRTMDCQSAAEARWNPGAFPDNYRLTDVELQAGELQSAVAAGVQTVVDTTPPALGRNPAALRQISSATGLNIVMGCGHYLEGTHSNDVRRASPDAIAEEIVREFQTGVGPGAVRPGIIGEIGTGDPMTAAEERVLRGAARAAAATGLALSVHLHPWGKEGRRVVEVLAAEPIATRKIVLNHLSTAADDAAYQRDLLASGAFLAYDLFGFDHSLLAPGRYPPSDADVALALAERVQGGAVRQLLVSQDIGVRTRLRMYGGWGYAHLLEHVVPLFRSVGIEPSAIDTMLVDNPRTALAY